MDRIEPRILRGFRDYLPSEMIPRQRMIHAIIEVFERFGFVPLQTPALEYADILLGKLGDDAEKLLYRFTDNGGRDVCLRYDLTVPLARVAAQYQDLPQPIKRYQIAPVWRAEKPGRGRFREFYQCDIDIVGSASLLADAECLAVDAAVMQALGVNVTIRVNNRNVLNGLALLLEVDEPARMNLIFRTIDKLPSAGEEAVRAMLAKECELSEEGIARVFQFLGASGGNREVLGTLRGMFTGNDVAQEGIAQLEQVLEFAAQLGVPEARVKLDPSIARGLDYYTGTVFETFIDDLPGYGSVMSGGRYDTLITRFLGKPMPAVGISVGIDRLFAAMLELGRVQGANSTAQALVAVLDADSLPYAAKVATTLRAGGVRTELFLYEGEKIKKQFKYADTRGIPVVAVVGSSERDGQTVSVKHLSSGEQASVALAQAAEHILGLTS